MKMRRNQARLVVSVKDDNGYVKMSQKARLTFMWELTAEVWSLRNKYYVERRLPRHITNIIKK